MRPEVTVLVRAECPDCEQVQAEVHRICGELAVPWAVTDVDTDIELRAEYGDRVPVVLIDGDEHASGPLSERRFRRALD